MEPIDPPSGFSLIYGATTRDSAAFETVPEIESRVILRASHKAHGINATRIAHSPELGRWKGVVSIECTFDQ
jgi:hypothetical protein